MGRKGWASLLAFVLAGAGLVGTGVVLRPTSPPPPVVTARPRPVDAGPAGFGAAELDSNRRFLVAVNAHRAAVKLPPLVFDGRLVRAARAQAEDNARRRLPAHTGSDGSDVGTRVARAGYRWSTCAENAAVLPPPRYRYAEHAQSVEAAVEMWMGSPGHKAAILGPYEHAGIAVAWEGRGAGPAHWVAVFGRSR